MVIGWRGELILSLHQRHGARGRPGGLKGKVSHRRLTCAKKPGKQEPAATRAVCTLGGSEYAVNKSGRMEEGGLGLGAGFGVGVGFR